MKRRGGSRSVEKRIRRSVEKRGECWCVEHLVISSEIIVTFTIIFKV
jgi:hypothetical protein